VFVYGIYCVYRFHHLRISCASRMHVKEHLDMIGQTSRS
jgi:hypothetical protein